MTADPRDEFLTVAEVAEWLAVTRGTVYSWKSRGQIPWTKIGGVILIPKRALLEHLQRATINPSSIWARRRRQTKVTRRVAELRDVES